MNIAEVVDGVTLFFKDVMKQKCRVLTVSQNDKSWKALCEVNVDPDYTTRRGMGDIVEIYEVEINGAKEVVSFSLKETKRKASLDSEM